MFWPCQIKNTTMSAGLTLNRILVFLLLAPVAAGQETARRPRTPAKLLTNDECSPLFVAVIEATEEAIYNSRLQAVTTTGNGHTVQALPIDKTTEILRKYR